MLAGVSTRKYRRAQEPVGEQVEADARSTSKSAVSRAFVQRTRDLLWKLMNRPLADLRLAVIMLDGIVARECQRNCVRLAESESHAYENSQQDRSIRKMFSLSARSEATPEPSSGERCLRGCRAVPIWERSRWSSATR